MALSADPAVDHVSAVTDAAAIDDAVDAGVVRIDGGSVRAAHPLLAATALRHAGARERRELHLALAAVLSEEQLRVLHLALATLRLDAELAARLAAAADDACSRGAPDAIRCCRAARPSDGPGRAPGRSGRAA